MTGIIHCPDLALTTSPQVMKCPEFPTITCLRFSTPTTRHSSSTTVVGSEEEPILQVHDGWYAESDFALYSQLFSGKVKKQ